SGMSDGHPVHEYGHSVYGHESTVSLRCESNRNARNPHQSFTFSAWRQTPMLSTFNMPPHPLFSHSEPSRSTDDLCGVSESAFSLDAWKPTFGRNTSTRATGR